MNFSDLTYLKIDIQNTKDNVKLVTKYTITHKTHG